MLTHASSGTTDFDRVAAAIRFIDKHHSEQPTLEQLAGELGLSAFHAARMFRRWAGISPKRFLAYLTVQYAKRALDESSSVLDAALGVGLSGPGRLHDHFVALEAVTPGEYKTLGTGLAIRYGIHDTRFGRALVAVTPRGICALSFVTASGANAVAELRERWPLATMMEDQAATAPYARRIFAPTAGSDDPLRLFVKGTNFQVAVWKALLSVPFGTVCSYEQLARSIDKPLAWRAVANAVGANPIAVAIPCHRVIRSVGSPGGYRWGAARKRALIAWEAARTAASN